jgi:hypothetical protein
VDTDVVRVKLIVTHVTQCDQVASIIDIAYSTKTEFLLLVSPVKFLVSIKLIYVTTMNRPIQTHIFQRYLKSSITFRSFALVWFFAEALPLVDVLLLERLLLLLSTTSIKGTGNYFDMSQTRAENKGR